MKCEINNINYDLGGARYIAARDNDKSPDDFNYFCETLYQTPLKQFFLLLVGKAFTLHNPYDDTTMLGGIFFKPMTDSQAVDWMAEHDLSIRFEE